MKREKREIRKLNEDFARFVGRESTITLKEPQTSSYKNNELLEHYDNKSERALLEVEFKRLQENNQELIKRVEKSGERVNFLNNKLQEIKLKTNEFLTSENRGFNQMLLEEEAGINYLHTDDVITIPFRSDPVSNLEVVIGILVGILTFIAATIYLK